MAEVEGDPTHSGSTKESATDEPIRSGRLGRARSWIKDFGAGLGAVDFADHIVLFGASLLLSVLPLIILLGALASQRVDDDIAQHLGLNAPASRVVEGLFTHSKVTLNLGIVISLVLSLLGTIAVARSVQVIYEKSFRQEPKRGATNMLRCLIWVAVTAGLVILDAATAHTLRAEPAGVVVLGLVNLVELTLFFGWGAHFLLAGREPWARVAPVAVITAVFWIGLAVFASVYFSSTLVSDSRTYGTIGVAFTLVTWFIAMGAVITLGAVIGVLTLKPSPLRHQPE